MTECQLSLARAARPRSVALRGQRRRDNRLAGNWPASRELAHGADDKGPRGTITRRAFAICPAASHPLPVSTAPLSQPVNRQGEGHAPIVTPAGCP